MSKKIHVFKALDRDCVNPASREFIRDYINNLIKTQQQLTEKIDILKKEKHKLYKKKY
uniref:DNA binding protein n=1 Tax=Bacillus phage KoopaTroopa TaxID=3234046 RepID=A0AB39C773_9CAUD